MTHQHDSKQHLLTGLGRISRECRTIGTCLSNMFCSGRRHVQGGVVIVQPARWGGGRKLSSVRSMARTPHPRLLRGDPWEVTAPCLGFSSPPCDLDPFATGSSSRGVFSEESQSREILMAMGFMGKMVPTLPAFSPTWLPWCLWEMDVAGN